RSKSSVGRSKRRNRIDSIAAWHTARMAIYYYILRDGEKATDREGIEIADSAAVRDHAIQVARALTNQSQLQDHDWSNWVLSVQNEQGSELFSIELQNLTTHGNLQSIPARRS